MAKTTQKTDTADVFAFPAVDGGPIADQFRTMAEQGLAKSKEAYETAKTSMEDAQKTLENSLETAQSHGSKLSLTAIGAMRSNAESSFAHLENLVGVKTLAEAFEIQSAFVRKQAELAVDQAKEMQVASKDAFDAMSAPVKEATEKAMSSIKAA
jgi:phasin